MIARKRAVMIPASGFSDLTIDADVLSEHFAHLFADLTTAMAER